MYNVTNACNDSIDQPRGRRGRCRCQLPRRRRRHSLLPRPFGNFQSPERERERDNCDYCEFSGAKNYVNEVKGSEEEEKAAAKLRRSSSPRPRHVARAMQFDEWRSDSRSQTGGSYPEVGLIL